MSRRPKKQTRGDGGGRPASATASQAAAGGARSQDRWKVAGVCVLLVALVWIVFGRTLGFGFVDYDDDVYITLNPTVQAGVTLQGLYWAFTFGAIGHWHPLTWLTHMLDCQMYGLWAGGHHLTNVLLHGATAVCLFLVLRNMTGSLWRSACAAAIWAIHPLRVESVAWVAERKDVLSGLFFVLTLGVYARYARKPGMARYSMVVALFSAGLLAKNMLVTLPCVLLLLDYWPLRRWHAVPVSRLVVEKIPLFALSAASCAVTFLVPEKLAGAERLPLLLRLENCVVSYVIYLRQMVWPAGLATPYPNPGHLFSIGIVAGAIALLAGISTAAVLSRKNQPVVFVGWFWFIGMLAPVIGVVQVSTYAHADRYTYLPQIGLCVLFTWAAADVGTRLQWRPWVPAVLSAFVIGTLAICAGRQTTYWHDSESLFTRALACTEDNHVAEGGLGGVLQKNGELDKAIYHYQRTLELMPDQPKAHYNLGYALQDRGRLDQAIPHFELATGVKPGDPGVHGSLGMIFLQKMRPVEAIAHFEKALEIDPNYVKAQSNLAYLLATSRDARLRDGARAVKLAARANELTGNRDPVILGMLAAAYAEAGRFPDAVGIANRAIQMAGARGDSAMAGKIQGHLKLYEAGQPLRDF